MELTWTPSKLGTKTQALLWLAPESAFLITKDVGQYFPCVQGFPNTWSTP